MGYCDRDSRCHSPLLLNHFKLISAQPYFSAERGLFIAIYTQIESAVKEIFKMIVCIWSSRYSTIVHVYGRIMKSRELPFELFTEQ